jgi:hypothetical protein
MYWKVPVGMEHKGQGKKFLSEKRTTRHDNKVLLEERLDGQGRRVEKEAILVRDINFLGKGGIVARD